MRCRLRAFVLLAILTGCGLSLVAQQPGYFISNKKKIAIATFNKEIERVMHDIDVPGVSLAIIENNEVVFANAYGVKDLSKKNAVNKNTVFEACSLSKSYLVYVVFKLVDEGKLDLDKPLYEYLPNEQLAYDARYKLITPRMVLSHCTGLENWRSHNNKDTLEILYNPGEKYTYSGEAYNYLARVAALILQKPYEQYVDEIALKPLGLNYSYLLFKDLGEGNETPADYAVGHTYFGQPVKKWKNRAPVPSSANNVTAEDYAKLVIATFDKKHLSAKSSETLLQPLTVVRKAPDHSTYYYAPGFEVFYRPGDTIIAHGGSNQGFKGQVFYSVTHKRGFVLLTNGDRGRMMTSQLSAMTAGLDIYHYYDQFPIEHQYPSLALNLLKTCREKDTLAMLREIEKLKKAGKMDRNTWNELGFVFTARDTDLALKFLEESRRLYPNQPDVYCLLGDVYWEKQDYPTAYDNYVKARSLNFSLWEIKPSFLKDLQQKIADREKKKEQAGTQR
jgi:CubicO group peptidase (beta-lactamase class C family)